MLQGRRDGSRPAVAAPPRSLGGGCERGVGQRGDHRDRGPPSLPDGNAGRDLVLDVDDPRREDLGEFLGHVLVLNGRTPAEEA